MKHGWLRRFRERHNALYATLKEVPLFRELSFGELREVIQQTTLRRFFPGDPVFEQGVPGDGVWVVLSGKVDILQKDAESGEEVLLSSSGQGAFLGETALLDDAPRTASAVARTETEMALFTRESLVVLAEKRPHLGVKVAMQLSQIIAERLRRTNLGLRTVRDELETARQKGADGK